MVIYKLHCKESDTHRQILGGQRDLSKHSNVKNEEHSTFHDAVCDLLLWNLLGPCNAKIPERK